MDKLFAIFFFSAAFQLATCKSVENSPFIVGGEPANIADFPHQLLLQNMQRNSICGASNIHRLWALSAAHCLDHNTPPELINLYGGSSSRVSGGHLFFASRYILHPSYNRRTLDFDIAVIQVLPSTPLEGFLHVHPIPLSPPCASACCGACPEGNNIIVTGWGRIADGTLPVILQQVSKPIISNAVCSTYWNPITSPITTRMLCTLVEHGRDSCNGDSGSAVIRNGVQVGLVAFGSSVCGDGSRPAVYTRIEHPDVRSFITQHTGV